MTSAHHAASLGWHRLGRLSLLLALTLLLALPQAANASFRVEGSSSVNPGDLVTFTGDFSGDAPKQVSLTMRPGGTNLGSAPVDSSGNWTLSALIPASTPPGSYRVYQEASGGSSVEGDSILLEVKAPPDPPQQVATQPAPVHTGQGTAPTSLPEPDPGTSTGGRDRSDAPSGTGSSRGSEAPGSRAGGDGASGGKADDLRPVKQAEGYGGRFGRDERGGPGAKPGDLPRGDLSAKNTSAGVRDFELPWASIALGGGGIILIIAVAVWGVMMALRRPDDPTDEDDGPGDDPKPDRPGPWDPLEAELQEMIAEERARRRDPVAPH